MLELFSISEGNRPSVDKGTHSQPDGLFSSPEPEESATDNDSSVASASNKRGGAVTSSHFLSHTRTSQEADQGKSMRAFSLCRC